MPFLVNDDPPPTTERLQSPAERARYDDTTKCILCAACTTACPTFWQGQKYVGPAAIVNAHRFIFDSRDRATAERLEILHDVDGVWRCREGLQLHGSLPPRHPGNRGHHRSPTGPPERQYRRALGGARHLKLTPTLNYIPEWDVPMARQEAPRSSIGPRPRAITISDRSPLRPLRPTALLDIRSGEEEREELVAVDRLGQVVVEAGLLRATAVPVRAVAGDFDEQCLLVSILASKLRRGAMAIHSRQIDVEEDGVRPETAGGVDGRLPVVRTPNLPAR